METTTSSTGSEVYDQLLKFTRKAKDIGVTSFILTMTKEGPSLQAHMLPDPPTPEEQKKQDEADLFGSSR